MSKGSTPRPFTDREIFESNFDKIFKVKKKPSPTDMKEYEYELHPSTGEVVKKFKDGC
jgi:AAA15 family ATPase/GTPase